MEWPLLAGLSAEERQALLRLAVRRRFTRREVVFHEGDVGDTVHLLEVGHVALRVTTPRGDAALVRVVCPGEFFGELVLLSDAPRSATAISIERSETLSLHRDAFNRLRRQFSSVQDALDRVLVAEVRHTTEALSEALYVPAKVRLWRRVRTLADAYADGRCAVIPMTQEEIGELAGVTRPTANRLLREAESAGALVLSRGQVTIVDRSWVEHQSGTSAEAH